MEGLVITHKGIEDIAKKEVKELIKAEGKIEDSIVVFKIKKLEELCTLCYKAQSVKKVLLLLAKFNFKKVDEISKAAKKIDFSKFIKKDTKIRVSCKRKGEHSFESHEVEEAVGGALDFKVDLENPEVVVYVYLHGNRCYIGVDFAGHDIDLSKRDYRVFTHSEILKSNVGYALLRIVDYKKEQTLLDPFCGPSIIPIEAALYATDFPVRFHSKDKFAFMKFEPFKKFDFDRFFEKIDKKMNLDVKTDIYAYDDQHNHIMSSQKNAKIAGINKKINFSRVHIEWLDTKFDKEQVDKIVTKFFFSKRVNPKETEKLLREFFYQTEFVLNKKGLICLVTNNVEKVKELAAEKGFKTKEEREIVQGKLTLSVLVLKK